MAKLVNIKTGEVEEVSDALVPDFMDTGEYANVTDHGTVNVTTAGGSGGSLPLDEARARMGKGQVAIEKPAVSEERVLERMYGDRPFTTAAEEFASGATFGLYDVAGEAIGGDQFTERRRETAARNQGAAMVGAGLSALAPIPGTTGWAAAKAGKVVKAAVEAKVGAKIGGRLVSAALGEATGGALWGLGAGVEHVALSAEPMNGEQIAAEMGKEILLGAGIGMGVGVAAEGVSSAWNAGKARMNAFRAPDGTEASAGDVLTRLPRRAEKGVLKDYEQRLTKEANAEAKALLGEKNAAVEEIRGQQAGVKAEQEAGRVARQEVRDQLEAELGVLDDAAEMAHGRAKLNIDFGSPDSKLLRAAQEEMEAAKAEVQRFLPHEGRTVPKRVGDSEQIVREFSLHSSADDVANLWNREGENALAAIKRYERSVLALWNAVQPEGKKVLSSSELYMQKSAPDAFMAMKGPAEQMAQNAERLNAIEGAIYDLGSEQITSARLEALREEIGRVRLAMRGQGGEAAVDKALGHFEKVRPGIVSSIPEKDVDAVLAASNMPNTPYARKAARYHLAEGRINAASKGKVGRRGLGDMLIGVAEGRAAGWLYAGSYAAAGMAGPVLVDIVRQVAKSGAGKLKSAADKFLGKAAKAAEAGARAAKKAATPALLHMHDDSKPWSERVAPIMQMANPAVVEQAVKTGPVGQLAVYDPETAIQVRNITWQKYNYLAAAAPKSPFPPSPFGGYEYEPSDMDKARFLRQVEAAEGGPAAIVEHVADGTVTPEEVDVLRNVYPESYSAVTEYIAENLVELQTKLPYDKRLTMSILFGQPVEMTASPAMVATFQNGYTNQQEPQQPSARIDSVKTPEPTKAQKMSDR